MHSTYNQAKRLKSSDQEHHHLPSVDPASDPSMATFSNVSSKYRDIISKSLLLPRSGSPSIYQLKPKKEKFGTLTKLTVGKRDVKKVNKTILLAGETGTGKSTLINALVNHTMGVKMEDEVWFQIIEEEEKKKDDDREESQTESQTSDVIVYQVFGFEGKTLPYSLTIIDTPGFGSTRGVEHDIIVTERLLEWFRSPDGVHEVNAVGLVMKSTENRLSDRLGYIFDSVMSLFGKNIEKNIVALITHSNGRNPKNALQALKAAKIKCARNEKNQPVYFLFDNCQHEDRTEEEEEEELGLKHAWRVTDEGMKQFMTFLEETGPQNLNKTVEVLNERVRLTACIQNLQDRIEFIELQQTEIRQIEEALKKHEEEKKKNKEVTVEVDEVYKDKQRINGGMWGLVFYEAAVTCKVCEENCHYPGCTVAWSPAGCEVMKGGRCTSCTRKCPVKDHVKENWRYVTKTRRVKKTIEVTKQKHEENLAENDKKTLEDMKQKYEKNQAESEKKSSLLENLKAEMNHLEADKTRWLEEAYQHVVNLNQIALKVLSVSTYVNLDYLIEKMKENGDTEKVQELEEMKKQEDKGLRAAVKYMWGRMKSAGKAVTGWMK